MFRDVQEHRSCSYLACAFEGTLTRSAGRIRPVRARCVSMLVEFGKLCPELADVTVVCQPLAIFGPKRTTFGRARFV